MTLQELQAECDRIVGLKSAVVDDHEGVGTSFEYRTSTGLLLLSLLVAEFQDTRRWYVYDILLPDREGEPWTRLRHLGRQP